LPCLNKKTRTLLPNWGHGAKNERGYRKLSLKQPCIENPRPQAEAASGPTPSSIFRFTTGMNGVKATFFYAEAAVITFFQIDHGKIIFHSNRLVWADPKTSLNSRCNLLSQALLTFPPALHVSLQLTRCPCSSFGIRRIIPRGQASTQRPQPATFGLVNLRQPVRSYGNSLKRAGSHTVAQA